MRPLIVLFLTAAISACATYEAAYQERVVKTLPRHRNVTFSNSNHYPGKILCGSLNSPTASGFNYRTMRYIAGPDFVRTAPSEAEWLVFCSADPEVALYAHLGIGAPDDDWAPLVKVRDDMRALGTAVMEYFRVQNTLPMNLEQAIDISPEVTEDQAVDPWGRPYFYRGGLSGRTVPRFELSTLGANGEAGGRGLDADIIYDHIPLLDHVLSLNGY